MVDPQRGIKRTSVLLLFLVGFFAFPLAAEAVEVEPGYVIFNGKAGRKTTFKLTFRTDQNLEKIWVAPADYWVDRTGSVKVENLKDLRYSARRWCQTKPSRIVLRKGRKHEIEFPMLIPGGTPGGQYYLGVKVQTEQPKEEAEGELTVQWDLSVIVLVIVNIEGGRVRIGAKITEPKIQVKDATPQVQATFTSESTVAVIARIGTLIRDSENKILDKIILKGSASQHPDGQGFVLPEGLLDFKGVGNRKLPAGKYTAQMISIYGHKNFRTSIRVPFEVKESSAVKRSPLDDVIYGPQKPVMELPAGGVSYNYITFKNRGYNTVTLVLVSKNKELDVFPKELTIEPGRLKKVRVRIRLPRTEAPRRDLTFKVGLKDSSDKKEKSIVIAIYAPGTSPKVKKEKK